MRAKGMTYDTDFVRDGQISRERFDPAVVRRELTIIRDDLHCNAVQITGGDPERLDLFELESLPHRPDGDPRLDLDLASPSIVKTLAGGHGHTYPDMAREPKAAFHAVAQHYRD